jgi:hypothetical protein
MEKQAKACFFYGVEFRIGRRFNLRHGDFSIDRSSFAGNTDQVNPGR